MVYGNGYQQGNMNQFMGQPMQQNSYMVDGSNDPRNMIVIHGQEGARQFVAPKNSLIPLFDDERDYFYMRITSPDGIHQVLKRYCYYEDPFENDGSVIDVQDNQSVDTPIAIEDKSDVDELKKMVTSLADQVNTLTELLIEQQAAMPVEEKDSKSSTAKKTTTRK